MSMKPKSALFVGEAFADLTLQYIQSRTLPDWCHGGSRHAADNLSTISISKSHGTTTMSVLYSVDLSAVDAGGIIAGVSTYNMGLVALRSNDAVDVGCEIVVNESARSYSTTSNKHYCKVVHDLVRELRGTLAVHRMNAGHYTLNRFNTSAHQTMVKEVEKGLLELAEKANRRYRQQWWESELFKLYQPLFSIMTLITTDVPAHQESNIVTAVFAAKLDGLMVLIRDHLMGMPYRDGAKLIEASIVMENL